MKTHESYQSNRGEVVARNGRLAQAVVPVESSTILKGWIGWLKAAPEEQSAELACGTMQVKALSSMLTISGSVRLPTH